MPKKDRQRKTQTENAKIKEASTKKKEKEKKIKRSYTNKEILNKKKRIKKCKARAVMYFANVVSVSTQFILYVLLLIDRI